MPEVSTPHSNEQRLMPDEISAAEGVFAGVYGAFAEKAESSPTERKRFIDGQEKMVTVDPALEFVQQRFEEAGKSVEPLANQPTSPSDISDKFIEEATAEAKSVYDGRSVAIGTRVERAKRVVSSFIGRASEMFQNGEADGLTIKLFLDRMQGFKYGLSTGYNNLVTKADEPMPDKETTDRYAVTVRDIFAGRSDVQEQDSGSFLHVNGDRHLASGSPTTERIYISPKLNEQPGEVVKVWADTLKELGLDEKVYYKVAEGMSRRYDTVITYVTPETASDAERAVQEFVKRCPPELLSDTTMPSGIEVAKGISRAPEPGELNTLLRYRGKDTISYNEFACAITELALRRASYDFMKQGIPAEQVTPKDLSEVAQPFFVQFVKLSGLDPVTMKVA